MTVGDQREQDLSDGSFANPVVRGVAADPSVIRVGDDYFMASSSFEWWPGIPIRHSRDLVNWQIIGHAVARPDHVRPDGVEGPFNLFAPTIRFHDGTFFVVCTNAVLREPMKGPAAGFVGNFIVHTTDPAGEWSSAVWVDHEAFDPSLCFTDGTCYYTRRTFDLSDPANGLGPVVQAEIDPFTGELADPVVAITDGRTGFVSNDIEGPHLYAIDGRYYLCSAEGGTEKGHMQTIARSDSPWGPFEPCPHNPILSHRHLVASPFDAVGHAELVETVDGSWWAFALATRPNGIFGPHTLGRETVLAPVRWDDGWPTIGDGGRVASTESAPPVADARSWPTRRRTPWTDGWSLRQWPVDGITFDAAGGAVELCPSGTGLDDDGRLGAVFVRQLEHRASLAATVAAPPTGVAVGITAYTHPAHHYDLWLETDGDTVTVCTRRRATDLVAQDRAVLIGDGPYRFEVSCDADTYTLSVTDAAGGRHQVEGSGHLLSCDLAPGFGSVRLGLFATGQCEQPVRFESIEGDHVG